MALTRTTMVSAVSTAPFGAGTFTTGAFTPPNNSLLVVVLGVMEQGTSGVDPSGSIRIVSGGGWTYTAQVNLGDAASFAEGVRIFTAPVGTGASMTLGVDLNGKLAQAWVISVVAYTGYDTGSPVGQIGSAATNVTDGAWSFTLPGAPASSSEVVAALVGDKDQPGIVQGTAWTEIHDLQEDGELGLETQVRTGSTSTTVDWQDILVIVGNWFKGQGAAIEVKAAPAAGGGPPQVLAPAGMRPRWSRTPVRRGEFINPPRVQGPLPPVWVPPMAEPAGMRPRWVRTLVRRGQFVEPIWPQGPLPANWVPPVLEPARRAGALSRVRRGRFISPPWPQGPLAPGWVPAVLEPTRRAGARPVRRGRFINPPWTIPVIGPPPQQKPARIVARQVRPSRRGRFVEPPWPQGTLAANWVPPVLEPARRAGARPARRGAFTSPPWTIAVPSAPPAWLAPARRQRARPTRRGAFWTPPWAQGALPTWTPPPLTATHRAQPRPVRRGRLISPPWTITTPPTMPSPLQATRRAPARPPRRGRFTSPPWPQGPLAPFLAPAAARATRRQVRPVRHGRMWSPPWPQGAIAPTNNVAMTIDGTTTGGTFDGELTGPPDLGGSLLGATAEGRSAPADTGEGGTTMTGGMG